MAKTVTRNDFAACLESVFRSGPTTADQVELTLKQVSELKSGPGQESFSIIFSGPADQPLPQGSYPLEHDRLGCQEIFIVPIGKSGHVISYEAIFNRFLS